MTQFQSEKPPAYVDGFSQPDYDAVMASLATDPSQALLSFGDYHTTLLHAAAHDNRPEICELLIRLGANVNARESNGRMPLHNAANYGCLDATDILIHNGADLEAQDNDGMTPLMWAVISRSRFKHELVTKLISAGARKVQPPETIASVGVVSFPQ